jgi:hypothetical protein
MAQVSTEFTGDNKRLITSYQQIQRENVKLREEMLKTKQAAMAAAKETESSLGSVASLSRAQVLQMGGLVTGLLSVGSAVGVVTRGYDEWKQKIADIAKTANAANADLTRMLAQQDELANGPLVSQRLGAIRGVTGDQARAAFAGVSGSIRAPTARRLDLTEQAARVAPLGLDLGGMGALTGAMADISPDLSAADAADLAFLVQSQGGGATNAATSPGFGGNVRLLLAAGIPREQAIAFALHAESRGAGSGFVKKAADTLKTNKFARLDPGERLQALAGMGKGERERAFGMQARGFDVVDFGEIAADASRLGAAFSGDVVGDRVQAAQATREGRMAAEVQRRAAAKDARERGEAPAAQVREMIREDFTNQLAERRKAIQNFGIGGNFSTLAGWADSAYQRTLFEANQLGLDLFSGENAAANSAGALFLTLGHEGLMKSKPAVEASSGEVLNTLQGILRETMKANQRGARGPQDERQHGER